MIAIRSPSRPSSRSVIFQQVSLFHLSNKKQYDKWNAIHSGIKHVGCNKIFNKTSDRLKSYSICLVYLLLFLLDTWFVKNITRDAWFNRKIQRDVWLEHPFCHPHVTEMLRGVDWSSTEHVVRINYIERFDSFNGLLFQFVVKGLICLSMKKGEI